MLRLTACAPDILNDRSMEKYNKLWDKKNLFSLI